MSQPKSTPSFTQRLSHSLFSRKPAENTQILSHQENPAENSFPRNPSNPPKSPRQCPSENPQVSSPEPIPSPRKLPFPMEKPVKSENPEKSENPILSPRKLPFPMENSVKSENPILSPRKLPFPMENPVESENPEKSEKLTNVPKGTEPPLVHLQKDRPKGPKRRVPGKHIPPSNLQESQVSKSVPSPVSLSGSSATTLLPTLPPTTTLPEKRQLPSNPQKANSWRSSQVIMDPLTLSEEAMSELPTNKVVLTLKETKPNPRWFFREKGIWHPYSETLSQELEAYYEKKDNFTTIGDIKFDLKKSLSKKTGASKEKKLLRATWFFNDDDGKWTPYEDQVAKKLEQAIEGGFPPRVIVTPSPPRYVVLHAGGTFKQYRDTEYAREEGRLVWRGWEGRCTKR